MNLLAVDTATRVAGVAILNENQLLAESFIDYKLKHSKKLMPSIENLLDSVQMSYFDLDAFAVAIGPGSFTGLRIGLSTVKALSQVTDKPVIPVSTLESLAFNLNYSNGIICPLLDARRNQFYTALFQTDGSGLVKRLTQDQAIEINKVDNFIDNQNKTYILGDGAEKYFNSSDNNNIILVEAFKRTCHAASVGTCALTHLDNQTDYLRLEPSYLRPSYAEDKK